MLSKFSYFIATGFYSGHSPKMPGTAGTAVAILCAWIIREAYPQTTTFFGSSLLALAITILAIIATNTTIQTVLKDNPDDPQAIVIDEFAGLFVALIALPHTLLAYLLAFIIFRFFDMTKPYPIRNFEKLPGAYGIVLDDIAAGLISCLIINVCYLF